MFRLLSSRLIPSSCPVCAPILRTTTAPRIRAALHSSALIEPIQKDNALPLVGVEGTVKGKEKEKPKRTLKARKAAIELTPTALTHLRSLLHTPTPQLVRIGVRNKGCAGMSYHLEYVTAPSKFDEVVEQDGVKVVIDSKALFSIIGSKMDWREGPLGEKFVFDNPNIKDACGCGESFVV